jgi:hypothetical protein
VGAVLAEDQGAGDEIRGVIRGICGVVHEWYLFPSNTEARLASVHNRSITTPYQTLQIEIGVCGGSERGVGRELS